MRPENARALASRAGRMQTSKPTSQIAVARVENRATTSLTMKTDDWIPPSDIVWDLAIEEELQEILILG